MAKVYLGLGSNTDAHMHLRRALTALQKTFGPLCVSPVYESEAVGFVGENFLNLVVAIQASYSVGELYTMLREIENKNGRDRSAPRFSGRTLDIDILLYDSLVGEVDGVLLPREEILTNAFVLKPLCDMAPELMHPGKKRTMAQLWQAYDQSQQKLWCVPFTWHLVS